MACFKNVPSNHKVDSAADYLFQGNPVRGSILYPAPFGREATKEEEKIAELDAKTGASLKVKILLMRKNKPIAKALSGYNQYQFSIP